ncbi:TPA: hypothetical protein HA239_03045 [Candidatus Woesearchaeota archaeon]|nr:hypothetical protein QT06_C0001G0684 [archaeon GW2011_AR15]MBS3103529.1 hypothetical protein [Candidatus Woesearchaeota archaeon]HIH41367.1 hypothetical protein [Candidatus Woesearchaeota archaeon]
MKTHFPTLRGLLIRLKLYMSRTGSYISLVNTAMILFIFLSDLEKYNIDIEIRDWIIPIFIVGVLGMLTFGYLEDRLGFYSEEQKASQSRSPYFREIIERLDKIEKQLEKKSK